MDLVPEGDPQSTPTPAGPDSIMVAFPSTKMSASPRHRPGMPAGPRVRKPTQNSMNILTINGVLNTNGRRTSSESAAFTSGRNSPTLSATGSTQSPTNERRLLPSSPGEEPDIQTVTIISRTGSPNPPTRSARTPDPTCSSTSSSTAGFKLVSKPVTLPFPKPINFVAEPIAFRGLTLEAAQWTFTSDQLRDIVSKAIRDSAKESFIRILSPDVLAKEIPVESERLESLKSTAQAQHRFHFQRRTNLLQSLNAVATTIPVSDDGSNPLSSLIFQLAEIVSAMDRYTETLLHVVDQRAQVMHIQDVHVSSALAIALRKLNGSYSKRTTELKNAKSRIAELEAELDEAWKVAQDLAQEVDDLDNFEEEFGMDDELDDDEELAVERGGVMFEEGDLTVRSVANAKVVGITGTAFVSKATLVSPPASETAPTTSRSQKRNRSHSISRTSSVGTGTDGDWSSRVLAARKRSSRASMASLRIPKSLSVATSGSDGGSGPDVPTKKRHRSKSNAKKPPTDTPSVPPLPSVPPMPPGTGSANANSHMINTSFLELSRPGTPQPSSEEDIPPMPTLVKTVEPSGEEEGIMDTEETQVDLKDDGGHTSESDRSLTPPLSTSIRTRFLRPNSVDNGLDQLGHPRHPSDTDPTKTRRIQSMRPSTIAPDGFPKHELVNLDDDSPIIPGMNRPVSQDDPRVIPLPEDDTKPHSMDYNRFDRWPWSHPKKQSPSNRLVPSPTPSLLPELPSRSEGSLNKQRPKTSASSLFHFNSRRNSMPLPSVAIAALLPWKGEPNKRSSEPHLPSHSSFRSPRASSS